MSFHARMIALRENPDTAHAGMKWTEEEDVELMNHATSNMDVEYIAKVHKRTITAVKSRIMSNALSLMETNGMTLDEISKHVHIPLEELQEHKQMENQKKQKLKQKQGPSKDTHHLSATKSSHTLKMQDDDKYMQILIELGLDLCT